MKNKYYFNGNTAKSYLGKKLYNQYLQIQDNAKVSTHFAKNFCKGLIKWAKKLKVEYFCHWFVPLNGKPAYKYVKFFNEQKNCLNFNYKTLMRSEADASSFPSFPERETSFARGLIYWDGSPIFIKEDNGVSVMVIPSLLFSPNDVSLDYKTPLKKSEQKLNSIATKLLSLFNFNCTSVGVYLGAEQEYFLLNKACINSRADLKLLNYAVLNEIPIKGQTLAGNYFSEPTELYKKFMFLAQERLKTLGIFAEVMHSEVAPKQFEIVPRYNKVSLSCSQNQLIIGIIKSVSQQLNLVPIFTEKPFAYYNGSGKHNNLSFITNTGVNLFDCDLIIENLFKVAVISSISQYPELLKISTTSFGNMRRLGGKEAPPAIISVHLGELKEFDDAGNLVGKSAAFCDRNRTSPFAFNGNKWEFRMVGSSADCGFPCMVFCTIVSKKLQEYYNTLKSSTSLIKDTKKLIQHELNLHSSIIFNGNNYKSDWQKLAIERGLYAKSNPLEIYKDLLLPKNITLFSELDILNNQELQVIYNNLVDTFKREVIAHAKVTRYMLHELMYNLDTRVINGNLHLDSNILEIKLKLEQLSQKLKDVQNSKITDKGYIKILHIIEEIDTAYAELTTYLPSQITGIIRVEELLSKY